MVLEVDIVVILIEEVNWIVVEMGLEVLFGIV